MENYIIHELNSVKHNNCLTRVTKKIFILEKKNQMV